MLGLFGFLGNLFGTKKASEKMIDNVSNGIDKLFYTSEEKAEDAAKARREGFKVYMKWLESTSGSRLARRVLAIFVAGIWGMEHLSSVAIKAYAILTSSPENIELYNKLIQASNGLAEQAFKNNNLVGVVLLFYFGGPAAIDGVKGLVEKWTKK